MTTRATARPERTLAHDHVPHSRIQTNTSQATSGSWCRSRDAGGFGAHSPSSAGTGSSKTASM